MTLDQARRIGASPVLVFLARLLTLVVAFFAWVLVLLAAALVVLLHLIVAAMGKGTTAALSSIIVAEAAAYKDVISAFGEQSRQAAKLETPTVGPIRPSNVLKEESAERSKEAA